MNDKGSEPARAMHADPPFEFAQTVLILYALGRTKMPCPFPDTSLAQALCSDAFYARLRPAALSRRAPWLGPPDQLSHAPRGVI